MTDDITLKTEIELVPLETLVPYANNPKDHPPEQVDKIATSIRQYGMDQPIVIDASGEIIKGHGRYEASQQLGLEVVPVIWREGLSPPEVTGARIADNKTSIDSGFDYNTLATEVQQLSDEWSFNADEIGEYTAFPTPEIDELLERGTADIDDFLRDPEPDAEPEPDVDETASDNELDDADPAGTTPESPIERSTSSEGKPIIESITCPECGHKMEP